MFSSLIFAALAAAWLIVLVPMFARRRQEVSRTTDATLAARVVRRGSGRTPRKPTTDEAKEATAMPDTDRDGEGMDDAADVESEFDVDSDFDVESGFDRDDDEQWRPVYSDDVRAGRRYRPGRGGFDPEAAAMSARAKYVRRQRIVVVMLTLAVTTGVLAGVASPVLWWAHGVVDLALVAYLTYLRKQGRIEEAIRRRRLARLSASREEVQDDIDDLDPREYADQTADDADVDFDEAPVAQTKPGNAVVVEIDDEDPMFDELDERTWKPYRRASGE